MTLKFEARIFIKRNFVYIISYKEYTIPKINFRPLVKGITRMESSAFKTQCIGSVRKKDTSIFRK